MLYHSENLSKYKFLVTGGAGFIGSNIVEYLIKNNAGFVRVLDNLSTGVFDNVKAFIGLSNFELIIGDIRDSETCNNSMLNIDYVIHQAALGSVPRSIKDPITTNQVNIDGFLNVLVAARDAKVKRLVYAASSSTYGDSLSLPKIENHIGSPLSPYAITKYVNELYATIFSKIYKIECIGLRYFNVFGKRQDPNSAYAAVIPLFVKKIINHETLVINGNGEHSRDFTYIDNVVQMNMLAVFTKSSDSINTVYNTAYGERTTLNELVNYLIQYLSEFDPLIRNVKIIYGENRTGDVLHSLASIDKAKKYLNYNPQFNLQRGLKDVIPWYWKKFKNN